MLCAWLQEWVKALHRQGMFRFRKTGILQNKWMATIDSKN